jgi:hypothetical protein
MATQEELVMKSVNHRISAFFLKKQHNLCGDEHKNHVHHTHDKHNTFETDEMIKRRRNLLQLKQKERKTILFRKQSYKLTRREVIHKVSVILHMLIEQFMTKVTDKSAPGKTV